jgi:hypothetical protein
MLSAASVLCVAADVILGMPLKFSSAPDRAEVIPMPVNNERFSDLFATKLHFAHGIDRSLFGAIHNGFLLTSLHNRNLDCFSVIAKHQAFFARSQEVSFLDILLEHPMRIEEGAVKGNAIAAMMPPSIGSARLHSQTSLSMKPAQA